MPDSIQSSWFKAFPIKFKNIFLLALDGFKNDLCPLRASALTFYTMLSIVPVIAMLFGIAKGFDFEKVLQEKLLEQIPQQETMMLQLIDFAQNMLSSTKGGVVAGMGIAVLFFTVIKMVANIEDSFNHIWKVEKGRPIVRKINDYLSVLLLAPVLLIISSSITVFMKAKVSDLTSYEYIPDHGVSLVLYVLNYVPFVIIWGLFSFVFIFLPNTKVKFKPGIIAGLITAVLYHLLQWAHISLQLGVSSYNVIYGGFAALPLFVIWLQIAWMIVLFGSELSFFFQYHEAYRHKEKITELSFSLQKILALKITHLIINEFSQNAEPLNAFDISSRLSLPITFVIEILNKLIKSRIIVKAKYADEQEAVFIPAQDINAITVASVFKDLENCGTNSLSFIAKADEFSMITHQFIDYRSRQDENQLLKDINIVQQQN